MIMVIRTQMPMRSLDGEIHLKDNEEKEMTLGSCLIAACLAGDQQDVGATEKYRRWKLAEKIQLCHPCEISIEDVAYLKTLVGKVFSPLVMGQIWDILDPIEVKAEAEAPLPAKVAPKSKGE